MNNTSPNEDITLNFEGMNPNLYSANDNMMYMPAPMPNLAGNNAAAYPEIYYKLQPHVIAMCDQMDAYGMLPTKENMEHAANQMHENISKYHPEIMEYMKTEKKMDDPMPDAVQTFDGFGFGRGFDRDFDRGFDRDIGFDRGFRRRGPLRDVIDILLLQELFRRRRRNFW